MARFLVKEIDGDEILSSAEVDAEDMTVAASIAIGEYVLPGCDPDSSLVVMVTQVCGRNAGVFSVIDWNTPQADTLTPRRTR